MRPFAAYGDPVRRAATTALDRRIAAVLVGRVRRRWPISRLVPSLWLEPLLAVPAQRVRRGLLYGAAAVVATQVVVTAALLAVL
jgi:hypothetical protein